MVSTYPISPHVLSTTEAALLARARVERGVSAEARANLLYNDAITYLIMSLHLAPCEEATRIQEILLRLCRERGTLARDMAAAVPGVVTADGLAGTVVHLATCNGHTAFLDRVLGECGVDPARLPPFLGAHSPLCWAAMTDQRGAMRVVLEHYKRRAMLEEALTAPCHHTLTPTQAAERREDPLPVRPPYLLVFHAIEHRVQSIFGELMEGPCAPYLNPPVRHEYGGRVLGVQDLCALHAWRCCWARRGTIAISGTCRTTIAT